MNDRQKKATTFLSLAIVAVACGLLVLLAISVFFTVGSLGNRFPGREFMLVIGSWSALGLALKGLPPIITLGITYFTGYKLKTWQFWGMLIVSALGAVAAICILVEIGSVDTARRFWAYSPTPGLDSFEAFVPAARTGLVAIIVWLVAVVGLQLRTQRKEGG